MERYDSYKDSGVEWIGEIPSHWVKSKFKYNNHISSSNIDKKEYDHFDSYKIIHYNDVIKNSVISEDKDLGLGYCSESQFNSFQVRLGDIIITKDSMDVNNICDSSIVLGDLENVVFGYHLTKLTNINDFVIPIYNLYFFKSSKTKEYFLIHSNGTTIIGVSKNTIENTIQILPPLSEQSQIVQFLDEKTLLIDSLIKKTKRKIELLKEERTSLINHTVTKGLNPNVEMKDSGVEWIGEIPSHWKFIPNKYFTIDKNGIQTGPFGTQLNTKDYVDFGVKVMNQKTLINEDYEIGEEFISYEKFEELKGFDVIGGDLIMGSRGSFGNGKRTTFGKVSIVPKGLGDCVLHPCLIRIRLKDDLILKSYYSFYVNDSTFFLDEVRNTSNSTTIEVIYGVTLKDIRIPLPPLSEQEKIVSFLDEKTSTIDKTIELEGKRIEYLKEYRQSLISEVVTGKIKVVN